MQQSWTTFRSAVIRDSWAWVHDESIKDKQLPTPTQGPPLPDLDAMDTASQTADMDQNIEHERLGTQTRMFSPDSTAHDDENTAQINVTTPERRLPVYEPPVDPSPTPIGITPPHTHQQNQPAPPPPGPPPKDALPIEPLCDIDGFLLESFTEQGYTQVVSEFLTFRCPECRQVFYDYEGCLALRCHACDSAFCGLCLPSCLQSPGDEH